MSAHGLAISGGSRQLSPRLWLGAGAEIAVAVAVGAILLRSGHAPPPMPDMPGMSHHPMASQIDWTASSLLVAAVAAVALVWWWFSHAAAPAAVAAVGLVGFIVSDPVRSLALHSHLIAMAALEATLVAAPLLALSAVPRNHHPQNTTHSGLWTAGVVVAVTLTVGFLVTIHLPSVHDRAGHAAAVPVWLAGTAVVIGMGYWAAILLTAGRVAPAVRRSALVIGQEVAVILGLAALFLPSPFMNHDNPLGLSAAMDQRLGGALMVVTCAVVSLPLLKRIDAERLSSQRTEPHVH